MFDAYEQEYTDKTYTLFTDKFGTTECQPVQPAAKPKV